MTDKINRFIPDVGTLFYAERRPEILETVDRFNHSTGKVITLKSTRHSYAQRAVVHKCTSRSSYILLGTSDFLHSNRVSFVVNDWDFYPVPPEIMADMKIDADGNAIGDTPLLETSSDREITEGVG